MKPFLSISKLILLIHLCISIPCVSSEQIRTHNFALPDQQTNITEPDQALIKLMQGNKKFTKYWSFSRQKVAHTQKPFAVILTCSDSRVSPEILFNQLELGNLFVVRNAGNVIDDVVLGSIEYGVEHLGAVLIIVLGHERCGAVTAAVEAMTTYNTNPSSIYIKNIINILNPAVETILSKYRNYSQDPLMQDFLKNLSHEDLKTEIITDSIKENVKLTSQDLYEKSEIIRKAIDKGQIKIVGAYYDLDDGDIQIIY
jgi:carbonic anhydrase